MFHMRKWYADCVASDGTAALAYWAKASWNGLPLSYSALLVKRQGAAHQAARLHCGKEPQADSGGVAWQNGRLKFSGKWSSLDPPVQRTLFVCDEGTTEWSCIVPRGRAQLEFGDGAAIIGLGYVERLEMTIRPWRLPIRELRWGRFLSDSSGVVWIEWRGVWPMRFVSVNGIEARGVQISDHAITWDAGNLELEGGAVLREGVLEDTALARVPALKKLAPRSVREMHECKRVRRGTLSGRDGTTDAGWAIDEIVQFGDSP